jgi:hypothetical protein
MARCRRVVDIVNGFSLNVERVPLGMEEGGYQFFWFFVENQKSGEGSAWGIIVSNAYN